VKPMEIKLNLASKLYLDRQRIRFWLLLLCVFMLLLLVLNCSYGYQNWRQLNLLDSRFVELAGQVSGAQGALPGYTPEKYAALKSEVALENEIVAADQFRWTTLLGRFEALLPADVSIRTIQPDFSKHSVQLACVARDVSAMTQFIDNLLTSEDLNQAYLQSHAEVESDLGGSKQLQVGFSLTIREAF
jgi:Tfp pilus assembly protein PilN